MYSCHAILLTRFFICEADFDEWVNHHLSLGFSHIHVCDNNTCFDLKAACKKYGDKISYEHVDDFVCQYDVYERYINSCDADYVMPIDDDEYLWLSDWFKSIQDVIEHYGKADCIGIRWKHMFPRDFKKPRTSPVLDYCVEQNPKAARFFGGDKVIKCVVRVDSFVRYMDASENIRCNHVPVTDDNIGACLFDHSRTKESIVLVDNDEPVRLLHCPFKGYDEYMATRGSDRLCVSRRLRSIRHGRKNFERWLNETI